MSRGLGDVYKRQYYTRCQWQSAALILASYPWLSLAFSIIMSGIYCRFSIPVPWNPISSLSILLFPSFHVPNLNLRSNVSNLSGPKQKLAKVTTCSVVRIKGYFQQVTNEAELLALFPFYIPTILTLERPITARQDLPQSPWLNSTWTTLLGHWLCVCW